MKILRKIANALLGRLILAPGALLAGILVGRPMSGYWLAHYFAGSGRPLRLPRSKERKLIWLFKRTHILTQRELELSQYGKSYAELDYVPEEFYRIRTNRIVGELIDLYTTVGILCMWQHENGDLEYVDVYDWHPLASWRFTCRLGFLPFSFSVSGKDERLGDMPGKSFITRGIIPAKVKPGEKHKEKKLRPLSNAKLGKAWFKGSGSDMIRGG